jgi:hypothetical protein
MMERARVKYKEGLCPFYTRHRSSALPYLTEPWLAGQFTFVPTNLGYISLHLCVVEMRKTARGFRSSASRARCKSGNAQIPSRSSTLSTGKFSLTFYCLTVKAIKGQDSKIHALIAFLTQKSRVATGFIVRDMMP